MPYTQPWLGAAIYTKPSPYLSNIIEDDTTQISEHDPTRREHLPEHDKSTTNIGGSALGCVYGDCRTLWPNAKPKHDPEAQHHLPVDREGLSKA